MKRGRLIVIEGLDGSGKETQSRLLYERLEEWGEKVVRISYPRYEKESSALVKMYLRGDFGENPDEVSPYISSTFFAADRYASYKTEYESFYNEGGIVIADRYTTSNMMHQGCKIKDQKERQRFLDWLWDLEFNLYKIPIPDKVMFLDIPPSFSMERIKDRKNKITNESQKDIHESNELHLRNAYEAAVQMVDKYYWTRIDCLKNGVPKTIGEINSEIMKLVMENR
ncbi:dTMP kinase [Alkalibacter saccharofermentans]|uniref:Thymidylate kinase n=1 Tax=Alkalibacter saccharofermentans DSM 14828 TaxID=1120975 RepID=A0A1M4T9R3_9FIRM|nr:deoxynucleoside kinase [Alkalibacter saccharofermentans]SHE41201.1 dTMP kinase [Alkalibacter saccharofermentans DSM 14828]